VHYPRCIYVHCARMGERWILLGGRGRQRRSVRGWHWQHQWQRQLPVPVLLWMPKEDILYLP